METVKIARETIEGLFNLQVGLAEDTIQSLCAGIAECISGYAHSAPPLSLCYCSLVMTPACSVSGVVGCPAADGCASLPCCPRPSQCPCTGAFAGSWVFAVRSSTQPLSFAAGCRYAQTVLRQLGPVDALIPPLPGLVRYKEAIAVKAEAAKNGQTSPMW